jgi:hypothetical protein
VAPATDEPLGIDDEDGVVHHVLDEQAEQFPVPRRPVCLFLDGHVWRAYLYGFETEAT